MSDLIIASYINFKHSDHKTNSAMGRNYVFIGIFINYIKITREVLLAPCQQLFFDFFIYSITCLKFLLWFLVEESSDKFLINFMPFSFSVFSGTGKLSGITSLSSVLQLKLWLKLWFSYFLSIYQFVVRIFGAFCFDFFRIT